MDVFFREVIKGERWIGRGREKRRIITFLFDRLYVVYRIKLDVGRVDSRRKYYPRCIIYVVINCANGRVRSPVCKVHFLIPIRMRFLGRPNEISATARVRLLTDYFDYAWETNRGESARNYNALSTTRNMKGLNRRARRGAIGSGGQR